MGIPRTGDVMHRIIRLLLALAWMAVPGLSTDAHFNMLLPQQASATRGQPVSFVYQWGHPFEHQLFPAPLPQSLLVLSPAGKKTDLASTLEKSTAPAANAREVIVYRLQFTPMQRGDFLFLLGTP